MVFLITLIWFGFAAMSGAGRGMEGFLANLPNTLPWVGLFVLLLIAIRWELAGGSLILAAGLVACFYFNAWKQPIVFIGVCLPLIAGGAGLMASQWLDHRHYEV
jgi:hypothetical protein